MESYVENLQDKYKGETIKTDLISLFVAKEAYLEKKSVQKKVSIIKGVGLNLFVISLILVFEQIFIFNYKSFIFVMLCFIIVIILQWKVFVLYVSQIVPCLILERLTKEASFKFGDEAPS